MTLSRNSLLLLLALVSPVSSANVLHSIGIARDFSDSTIRYVEHHQYLASGDHRVTYFDLDGEVMATKVMTYPGLPQHPEISQSDFTRNIEVKTFTANQTLTMIRNASGQLKTHDFPMDESIIVDAGFDYFLRNNWQTFVEDVPRSYRFAIAGQERLLDVKIRKQHVSPIETVFTITPANLFIRMLMPEIRLLYNQDRRLITYEGLTNLNLANGLSRHVSVEFSHYFGPSELARPLAQWIPEK